MRRPERPRGFFIPDLVENTFGESWRLPTEALGVAARWLTTWPLSTAGVNETRAAFLDGGRVLHVCLPHMLQAPLADAVHAALEQAHFTPHHHAPYPLSIARRDLQRPSALMDFVQWLSSDAAAAYHAWLVNWPQRLVSKQVQVSRMGVGERFPPHHDTDEDGLAVVYNFTRDWDESFGGVLSFPHPSGTWDELRIPPLFNSVFIFRARDAPHEVTQVTPLAGGRWRYTVTAFLLAAP